MCCVCSRDFVQVDADTRNQFRSFPMLTPLARSRSSTCTCSIPQSVTCRSLPSLPTQSLYLTHHLHVVEERVALIPGTRLAARQRRDGDLLRPRHLVQRLGEQVHGVVHQRRLRLKHVASSHSCEFLSGPNSVVLLRFLRKTFVHTLEMGRAVVEISW